MDDKPRCTDLFRASAWMIRVIAFLALATTNPCLAESVVLDQRDRIPLPEELPTAIVEPEQPHSESPEFWLYQDFRAELYGTSARPGPWVGWHRLDLSASDELDGTAKYCLMADVHILPHLSFYLYQGAALTQAGSLGLRDAPDNASENQARPEPCFLFVVEAGKHYTLLIRKQNDGPKILPLSLYSETGALHRQYERYLFWGIVIAMLLTMALYNLVIYILDKNKAYVWYLAFHAIAFAYFGALTGYGSLLWPISFQRLVAEHIITLNFILIFVVVNFAGALLDAKTHAPLHARLIKPLSAVIAVGAVASLLVPEYQIEEVFGLVFSVSALFSIHMGVRAHRNGSRAARFFLLSWVFTLGGAAIGYAAYTQRLPQNELTLNAFLIGTLCELFLFSVALAFRAKDRERRTLELSLRHPETNAASFSYVKQRLPRHLRKLHRSPGELVVLVAQFSGYPELLGIYGPSALSGAFRRQTDHLSQYLAEQSWIIPMPMPTGPPAYLAALPDEQLFMLADRSRLPETRTFDAAVTDLADAAERFGFGKSLRIKPRITIGCSALRQANIDQAYRQAQVALLTALERGERWRFHADWMSREIERRARFADELREAVAKEELQLYIQPQFYLGTNQLRGAEILIRWSHPKRGLIGPGELIGLAERSGEIHSITRYVIERTCAWLGGLPEQHALADLSVSVNLSVRDLEEEDLPEFLDRMLERYAIADRRLILEITESAAAYDAEQFLTGVSRLKAHGFRLSIDDFGTGYSAMQYLQDIRPQELKIDMVFVRDLDRDPDKRCIVEAILRLADAAGAEVVAEGIETTSEAAELQRLGCKCGQGFLWQRPLPLAAFEAQYTAATRASPS